MVDRAARNQKGEWGGGGTRRSPAPRRRAAGGNEIRRSGLKKRCSLAWEKASGTGKLPRGLLGSGEVRGGKDEGGGGLAQGGATPHAVLVLEGNYVPQQLLQKEQGMDRVLTGAWNRWCGRVGW